MWQNCRKVCGTRLILLSSSQLFLSWFSFLFFPFSFFSFLSLSFFLLHNSFLFFFLYFFTSHFFFSQLVVLSFQLSLVWVVMLKICQFYFMGLPKSIFYGFLCFNICGFFFFFLFIWYFYCDLNPLIYIFLVFLGWSQQVKDLFFFFFFFFFNILTLGVFECFAHLLPPVKVFFHGPMPSMLHHQ